MKRRTLLSGMGAVLVAAAGGAAWRLHLFGRYYPPTPYDDLLNQIVDREPASMLGKAALKTMPGMTTARLADQLRSDPAKFSIRAAREPGRNRVAEVDGWVVPKSVALYAALAASV